MLARLGGAALSFALQLILARVMPQTEFGMLVVVMSWLALGGALACLSMPLVTMRFVAEHLGRGELGAARGVVRFALGIALAGSAAVALLALAVAHAGWVPLGALSPQAFQLAAALLCSSTLLLVLSSWLQGLHRVVTAELLGNVLRTLVVIVLVGAWVRRNAAPMQAETAVGLHLLATLLTLALLAFWAHRSVPIGWADAEPVHHTGRWRKAAMGFQGVMLLAAVSERVDVLAMTWSGTPEQVAEYSVATRFSQSVVMALVAVYVTLGPRVGAHMDELEQRNFARIAPLVAQISRLAFIMASGAAILFAVAGPWLLKLFGTGYAGAWTPLVILGAGLAVAAAFGPAMAVATIAGTSRVALAGLSSGVVCNVSLNLWLVPHWGTSGAAVATATAVVFSAVVSWRWTYRMLGLDTSIWGRHRA